MTIWREPPPLPPLAPLAPPLLPPPPPGLSSDFLQPGRASAIAPPADHSRNVRRPMPRPAMRSLLGHGLCGNRTVVRHTNDAAPVRPLSIVSLSGPAAPGGGAGGREICAMLDACARVRDRGC